MRRSIVSRFVLGAMAAALAAVLASCSTTSPSSGLGSVEVTNSGTAACATLKVSWTGGGGGSESVTNAGSGSVSTFPNIPPGNVTATCLSALGATISTVSGTLVNAGDTLKLKLT